MLVGAALVDADVVGASANVGAGVDVVLLANVVDVGVEVGVDAGVSVGVVAGVAVSVGTAVGAN